MNQRWNGAGGGAFLDASIPRWQRALDRVGRPATIWAHVGLLVVLLIGGGASYRAVSIAHDEAVMSRTVADIEAAYNRDRWWERSFRVRTAAAIRGEHQDAVGAGARLSRSLRDMSPDALRPQAERLMEQGSRYAAATERMLKLNEAAADSGPVERADVLPSYIALFDTLNDLGIAVHARTVAAASTAEQVQLGAASAALLAFMGCFALTLMVWHVRRAVSWDDRDLLMARLVASGRAEQRFRAIMYNAPDLVVLCGHDGVVTSESVAAERIWGWPAGGLVGRHVLQLVHPDDQPLVQQFWTQLAGADIRSASDGLRLHVRLLDGHHHWRDAELTGTDLLSDPDVASVLLTIRDVARHPSGMRRLAGQGLHDAETNLPSAALFHDRLQQALLRAARTGTRVAVIVVEVTPPASHAGHDGLGAELAEALALRLLACLRAQDTVARLQEDRFALVLEGLHSEADLTHPADRIARQLSVPVQVGGAALGLTWAGGMALGGTSPEMAPEMAQGLIAKAEVALGLARSAGYGRCLLFGAAVATSALDIVELGNDLRHADIEEEMRVAFRPLLDLGSRQLRGFEASLRWVHPVRGLVPDRDFHEAALGAGLAEPLETWALAMACRQFSGRHGAGQPGGQPGALPGVLYVALPAGATPGTMAPRHVTAALADSGLDPARLVVEAAASALLLDEAAGRALLDGLRAAGVRTAILDDGTEAALPTALATLRPAMLALDPGLLASATDPAERIRIQALSHAAHAAGIEVLAKGVDSPALMQAGQAIGCDLAYGAELAAAITVDDPAAWSGWSTRVRAGRAYGPITS